MASWLLKTEPGAYSFADLRREGRTAWTGVRNPVAQRNLRAMQMGDRAVVYHTGAEKAAVGVAEVVRPAYPDPADRTGALACVDLAAAGPLARPVTLAAMKGHPAFAGSPLLRQGRLSVVPLSADQWKAIEELARK
ncbi:MAG TPA: EVE domain-containing protein [Anaeromyxobacteraceae bacterium]|nr:EVE domain-containing protein [Anaeromyxobacteraceae bacterium]